MKFTIIMPTYNDATTIKEALLSLANQTYQNWELLISIDGSTDNTLTIIKDFIKEYKDLDIKYYYEENQDQLNAILNVLPYITGDYVYVLHSDDLICPDALTKANAILSKNPKLDALITDNYIIDENASIKGYHKTKKYHLKRSVPPLVLLWLGRNLYVDVAFHKTSTFITQVKENYLLWNTPFWLNLNEKPSMLNVENAKFPSFQYRVFSDNYINNEIGKLNVLNGELRTAINLMKYYSIPFYKIQYYIFRLLNKFNISYYPLYFSKETKNKYNIIKFILDKRYCNQEYLDNIYLNNLLLFYQKNTSRSITIPKISSKEFIYYGKDMRKFNTNLLNNKLSDLYMFIIKEMAEGFNEIIASDPNDLPKVKLIIKFLCIEPSVTIKTSKISENIATP